MTGGHPLAPRDSARDRWLMVSFGPEDCRNFSHVFDGFPPPAAVNRSAPMPTPNRSPAKTVTNQDRHTNNESDKAVQ
jgi:hypothetical protein